MKKQWLYMGCIVLAGVFSGHAQAASCRSGQAAAQGAQQAYEKDIQAAEENAQKEKGISDTLGKCIGSISGVITSPTFPSMSDVFNQMKNKVCRIANEKVNGAVNKVTNPVNGAIGEVSGGVNRRVNSATNIAPEGGNTNSQSKTPFWSSIWK